MSGSIQILHHDTLSPEPEVLNRIRGVIFLDAGLHA